jgi:hypothetical protein
MSVVFSVHQSLARACVTGFLLSLYFKKREREEKKSTKKRPKLRGTSRSKRGIHRQKIKRQKKQSATQTRHTQTRKHKTPESAKRGRYSLTRPFINARAHT